MSRALELVVYAAFVGLGCAACSSDDEIGRQRGKEPGALDASTDGRVTHVPVSTDAGVNKHGEPSVRHADAAHGDSGSKRPIDASADAGTPDSGGRIPVDAGLDATVSIPKGLFEQALVHALCDNVQACCDAAHRTFDANHCLQEVEQSFAVPLSAMDVYDPAKAGRCIDAVARVAEACGAVDMTACYPAFVGTVPAGGQCMSSFDCAPGADEFAFCQSDGHCVQPKRGVLDDPCGYTCIDDGSGNSSCRSPGTATGTVACHTQDGLVCADGATSATCQLRSTHCNQDPGVGCPAGQVCNVTSGRCSVLVSGGASCGAAPCESGFYCEGGMCASQKPAGAACTMDAMCVSGKCQAGLCVVYSATAAEWCGDIGP